MINTRRIFVLPCFALLLSGCNLSPYIESEPSQPPIVDYGTAENNQWESDGGYAETVPEEYKPPITVAPNIDIAPDSSSPETTPPLHPHVEEAITALIAHLKQKAEANFGNSVVASAKVYAKYTNRFRTRAIIDFESGDVRVETLDKDTLRYAITAILLTPYAPKQVDLFSDKEVPVGEEPMLYQQVFDQDGQPIRWQWRALRFADYLIANQLQQRSVGNATVYQVHFKLSDDHIEKRQYMYADLVRRYAHMYDIEESLVYAVILTESSFNPYAVSSSNAYGLMQIIPKTAGRDVFDRVKGIDGEPSKDWLFEPNNNIDTGTAYLALLNQHYLKKVTNPLSRKYTVISAYNGGAGNVFNTFDNDRDRAVDKINQLTPNQVYKVLATQHPRSESRRYLDKVSNAQKDFHDGKMIK